MMPDTTEEELFSLHRIVMHKIDKTGRTGTVQLREALLNVDSLDIKKFAQAVSASYHKRSSKEFAKFKTSPQPIYETLINDYTRDEETDQKFLTFSQDAANHLKDEMNKKPTSTGGYLIFADYTIRDRYIMAVLLNNKDGYTVNEDDLAINMINELNTDQIAMAGFINMTIYGNTGDDRRYLSFMKGVKNISEYFVSFLGSDEDKATSRDMTRTFVSALRDYFSENEYDANNVSRLEGLIYNHCEEKRTNREPVSLATISALINPENTNDFFEFTQTGDYQLNTIIESIDKSQINRLQVYKYSGKGLSVSFKRSLFENGKIRLIQNNTKLEITMPDEMKTSIMSELQ